MGKKNLKRPPELKGAARKINTDQFDSSVRDREYELLLTHLSELENEEASIEAAQRGLDKIVQLAQWFKKELGE